MICQVNKKKKKAKPVICLIGARPLGHLQIQSRGKAVGEKHKNFSEMCCLTKNSFHANGPASCNQHEPHSQKAVHEQTWTIKRFVLRKHSTSANTQPDPDKGQGSQTSTWQTKGGTVSLGTELLFPALTSHPHVSSTFSLLREGGLCVCNEIWIYKGQNFSLRAGEGGVFTS